LEVDIRSPTSEKGDEMLEVNGLGETHDAEKRQLFADVLVFHSSRTELARWTQLLSQVCRVRAADDLAGVERELQDPHITILVCDWAEELLQTLQASRRSVRLIHCGESIPDGIIEAAASGYQVLHLDRLENLPKTVLPLISPRSAALRHRLDGFTLRTSSSDATYRLLELSNEGFSFCVEADQSIERLLPGTVLDQVELFHEQERALARSGAVIRHLRLLDSPPGSYSVGCAFRRSTRADADSVTLIRDRAWCAALLRSALQSGGILLEPMDDSALATHCPDGLVNATTWELTIGSVDHPFAALEIVRGRFELGGSVYRFYATVTEPAPLTLRMPKVIEETQKRSSPRCQPSPKRAMVVELVSPLLSGPTVKTIRDISGAGFSFEINAETELFPPGMCFTGIKLRFGENEIHCRGQVRNLARIAERPGVLHCGVEFAALDESNRVRLADLIMRGRFADLRDGREVPFDKLWEFFLRTNFMYPDKEKKLTPLLPEIRRTFDLANARPNPVFKSVVFARDGEVVGYVSGLRAYRNTWMSQHLAASAGGRGGRLLNFGLAEYFGQNVDLEYFKIFYRPENRWPARVFGGFARNVSNRQVSDLRVFGYFTLPTEPEVIPAAPGIEVVEAATSDFACVERHFVASERGGLILRADDLTRSALGLVELNEEYRKLGLERHRRVLLAIDRGTLAGFALAEISSPGLNLSELLSAFSIHLLGETERTQEVKHALLRSLLKLYRASGRPFAVGLVPSEHLGRYQHLPLRSVKRYACWTCHRALYLRFCDHVDRIVQAFLSRQVKRASIQIAGQAHLAFPG
jgi:hypothetical protein